MRAPASAKNEQAVGARVTLELTRRLALGACAVMALGILLLQTVLTPQTAAPTILFALFMGLWLFGAVMLVVAPRFGAAGTAAWGVISAYGAYRTHFPNLSAENAFLIAGSLVADACAIAYLVQRVRAPAAATV